MNLAIPCYLVLRVHIRRHIFFLLGNHCASVLQPTVPLGAHGGIHCAII